MSILSELGGIVFLLYLTGSLLTLPISQFLFHLDAIRQLYLVKSADFDYLWSKGAKKTDAVEDFS